MSYEKEVGERVRFLRENRNLSLRELGSALDMDYSYLGKIERGFIPSTKTLNKIANFFDVELSYILGEKMNIPDELKPHIKEWYTFIEESEREGYTPEKIRGILEFVKRMKEEQEKLFNNKN